MKPSWSGTFTLGVLVYPLWVHLAVYFEQPDWVLVYLGIMLLGTGVYFLLHQYWLRFALVLCGFTGVVYAGFHMPLHWVMFLPPIIIFAVLAFLFGRSLLPGRTRLITNIAIAMAAEPICETQRHYTSVITWVWTLFFCIMCVESILLALFAPLPVWSYMTNFVNYLIVMTLFAVEFMVRKRIVKQDRYTSLFHFLSTMLKKRKQIRVKVL